MYNYVAFIWDPYNSVTSAHALRLVDCFRQKHPVWSAVVSGDGMTVFHTRPADAAFGLILLPDDSGVILGTLFPVDLSRFSTAWRPSITAALAGEMARSAGKKLIDEFWGSYVALLNGDEGHYHCVLRDCSGHVPCYTTKSNGVNIVFSSIEDLSGLPLPRFTINSRFLAAFIANAEVSRNDSALNEVQEVLAGYCIELRGSVATCLSMWNPEEIYKQRRVDDFEEASTLLRSVTQSCIDCWASRYNKILLRLSGGLDSAIILGCLRSSTEKPDLRCLTVYGHSHEDDERVYARLAALKAGVELIEEPLYSDEIQLDDRVFRLERASKPSVLHVFTLLNIERQNAVAKQLHAQTIWDGQGGDHFFVQGANPWGVVDYVHDHGILSNLVGPLRDSVLRSRKSYWEVLRLATTFRSSSNRWNPQDVLQRVPMFVNPEVLDDDFASSAWHPWAHATGLPNGKRLQVGLIADLLNRHRPISGMEYASERHPLFAQPLMNLCLQIPTYTLLKGGTDRALARAAFNDCVPTEIIRRETKGTINTSVMRKIRESKGFLSKLLLDGVLVRERILERKTLEPYLTSNKPVDGRSLWPLLGSVAAEVWASKWDAGGWLIDSAHRD